VRTRLLAGLAVALLSGCLDANNPGGASTGPTSTGATPNPAIWANGTGQACAIDAPAVSLPPELVATLPPIPPLDQLQHALGDDLWASFAQHIPGDWAGYFKANGKIVLLLADPTNLTASFDSVAIYGPSFGLHLPASPDLLEIRHTRWSLIQLSQWYQYLNRSILVKRGWTSSDIDEVTNRLRYSGATKAARDDILATLAAMHVPCWLAAVDIQGGAVLK
jgi:hypothetical protein